MEKLVKKKKGIGVSKILAAFLALLIAVNMCSNGAIWNVKAEDNEAVTIAVSGNEITYEFAEACEVEGIDVANFDWNTINETDKKTLLTSLFGILESEITDISKVTVGVTADTTTYTSKVKKLILTLNAGWHVAEEKDFNRYGLCQTEIILNNSKVTVNSTAITGEYKIKVDYTCAFNGVGLDVSSQKMYINSAKDVIFYVCPSKECNQNGDIDIQETKLLTSNSGNVTVKYTPDADFRITTIYEEIDTFTEFSLDGISTADGSYTFTYNYDEVIAKKTVSNVVCPAVDYEYKLTEFGDLNTNTLDNKAYSGIKYTATLASVNNHNNPDVVADNFTWSAVNGSSEYDGVDITKVDSSNYEFTLNENANNGDKFKIRVEAQDEAYKESAEITVDIKEINESDYTFVKADGSNITPENGWYNEKICIAPISGYNKIQESGSENYLDKLEITSSIAENERAFRFVYLNGTSLEKTTAWFYPVVNVDTTAPVISNVTSSIPAGEWSNQPVKIIVEANDSDSGISCVKYSTQNDVSSAITATEADGKYEFTTKQSEGMQPKYYIWAFDKSGKTSQVSEYTVNLEYEKPEIISVDNASANDWKTEGHTITVLAKDNPNNGAGLAKLTYEIPNGTPVEVTACEASGTAGEYKYVINTLKDSSGNYITDANEYTIKVYDKAGNVSEAKKTTVHVDKTKPEITAMTMENAIAPHNERLNSILGHFSNKDVIITVTAEKNTNLNEVDNVTLAYTLNNTTPESITVKVTKAGTAENGVQKYKAAFTVSTPENRAKFSNITVKAEDTLGNISAEKKYSQINAGATEAQDSIIIEKNPPSVAFELNNITGNGVYKDKEGKLWVDTHKAVPFTVTDDEAGIFKYTKYINDTKVITVQTDVKEGINKKITGTIETDAHSEVGSVILPKNGYEYFLKLEATDNAGNTSSTNCSIYVDDKAPVIKEVSASAAGWTKEEKVDIEIKAEDVNSQIKGSGIAKVVYYVADFGVAPVIPTDKQQLADWIAANTKETIVNGDKYEITASGEQNKDYYFFAVDNVGNVSASSKHSVQIDLTTPNVDTVTIDNADNTVGNMSYGNFSNKDVTINIGLNDGSVSSEIKSVKIYDNDKVIDEAVVAVNENLSYKCNIPLNKTYGKLIVEVIDNVGHTFKKELKDINAADKINNSLLTVENIAPTAVINLIGESTTVDNKEWVGAHTDVKIDIADEKGAVNSGIKNAVIKLKSGDKEKTYNYPLAPYDSIVLKDSITISTSDVEIGADGKYNITVTITDNAGNIYETEKSVYVDTVLPKITNVELYSANKDANGEYIEFSKENLLEYGSFYNSDAILRLTFKDDGASSGVLSKNVILNVGSNTFTPSQLTTQEGGYVAEYVIKLNTEAEISAEITDNVGHSAQNHSISGNSGSILSDFILLEKNAPNVNVSTEDADYTAKQNGVSQKWYKKNTSFTVEVKDSQAGLRSSNITLNGKEMMNVKENATKESAVANKKYTVNTEGVATLVDGSFNLNVKAIDNANNEITVSEKIYLDNTAPAISKYEFSPLNYKEGSQTPVVTTDYGYYFNSDTLVYITAADLAPTSGINKIKYRLDETGKEAGEVKELKVSENNQISFEVPKGFKGKIFTNAVDNVGNESGWQTVDGTIREEYDLHMNSSNVKITPTITTDKKDSSGRDLYSVNVPVKLNIEDTFSGVRTIEWSVEAGGDPANNQRGVLEVLNNGQLVGDGGWNVLASEANLRTSLEKEIVVANNSNDILISVKLTDRAGNVSQSYSVFSIDKSAPQFSVSYDNNADDEGHEGFFKEARTATITVNERNFTPDNIVLDIVNSDNVMPAISEWVKVSDGNGNRDNAEYRMNIIYQADGDYTFSVRGSDIAGNENNGVDYSLAVAPQQFTIDRTIPEISLSYDNNQIYNSYYFENTRTATITIKEHNFDASRAIVNITAQDNKGNAVGSVPNVGNWSSSQDINTARVVFDKDANYTIAVSFTDMAGNVAEEIAEQRFCIDYVDPEITITQVEDRHAYNSEQITPVVAIKDTNIDLEQTKITLTNSAKENVELKGSFADTDETRTFTFDNIEDDDIYTLTAEATDKSGRNKSLSYRFSVNRNGSTYELSDETHKMNGSYVKEAVDVVVREINVDALVQDSISVTLAKDNNSQELVADTDTQTNDYSLTKEGADGEWSEYTYTIRKNKFSEDGNYMVHLYSVDEATNVSQNDLKDDNKKVEINFNVDKTAPDVSILNIKEDETYAEDSRNAIISAIDNTYIENLKVVLNDEVVADYSADEIKEKAANNENFEVPVSNSTSSQKIEVYAIDAAGNDNFVEVSNFIVSSNLWVRFTNNTPLFVGTIIAVSVIVIGGGTALVFMRKRKTSKIAEK